MAVATTVAEKVRAPCRKRLLELGNECFVRGSRARWPVSSGLVNRARNLYSKLLEIDPKSEAAKHNLALANEFLALAPIADAIFPGKAVRADSRRN
jgi:hypothetical protein